MQSHYDEAFTREMGCTLQEWHGWLPQAIGDNNPWRSHEDGAQVQIADGTLKLEWRVGEPRVIALAKIPRLIVRFTFSGLDAAQRYRFMRRFDLYMQRGGG